MNIRLPFAGLSSCFVSRAAQQRCSRNAATAADADAGAGAGAGAGNTARIIVFVADFLRFSFVQLLS